MNRRDFLTSVAATVAALVARVRPERGGHVGGYVTEMAAIDTEGFILPPRLQAPCQGCYRRDALCDYSGCPYGYGTYEAFKEPQLHVLLPIRGGGASIFVAADGSDGNDGLSWDTRVRTLSHAIGLMRTGDKVYVGPGRHRGMLCLINDKGAEE